MANKHPYQIYALTHEGYAYVGKSFDSRPESVKWRHLRGDNKQTRAYFSREVAGDLQLTVLATVHTDSHQAYRYTIAYIRLLMECSIPSLFIQKWFPDSRTSAILQGNALHLLPHLRIP